MKKGFTLVELLAVIVIMTIIILIAVPNVISSVNSAKKENFGNEVTTVVSTAKTQFNLDKGRGTVRYDYIDNERVAVYCLNWHVEGEEDCNSKNKIAATNEEGTSYKIELDVSGNVKSTYMTDGRFYYSCCGEECTEYDVETIVDSAKSNDIPLTCDGKVFNNTSGNANNGENNNSSSQTHAHVKINKCRIDAMVAKDIEYYCYADQTVDECYGGRMATQVLYYSQKSTDDNSAFESCSATLANNKSNSFNDIVNCYNKAKTFDYCVSRAEDMYLDCESSGQNRFCTYKS